MSNVNIKLPIGDLASRRLAIPKRTKIEEVINTGNTVILDLSDVYSISESYADELFGVLTIKYGYEYLLQHIKIIGASNAVIRNIAIVIQRRKNEISKKSELNISLENKLAVC